MIPSNRRYVIINVSDLTDTIIGKCLQTSSDTCRKSVKGTDRVILSYNNTVPSELSSYTQYTHSQIRAIVDDTAGDWYKDPDSTD
jgi:hypothetical protein